MGKAALITIHGMGETKSDYADALVRGIRRRLKSQAADLTIGVVDYQHILQSNQNRVWQDACTQQRLSFTELRKFVLFGFGDAAGLETNKDMRQSTYEDAQLEIVQRLLGARSNMGGNHPLVVNCPIARWSGVLELSLGCAACHGPRE